MVKLLRVDHRLLHGQVAFSWTSYLQADCILIASDNVVDDELRLTTIKLAKPSGVKLVIKNIADSIKAIQEGKTDKYKLFIVVESVEDAAKIVRAVKTIKSINLGGTKPKENTKAISKVVHLTKDEIKTIDELNEEGVEIEVRQVPNDTKVKAVSLIKNKID
ncbi:PTS sugar transporter subunit IIB [Clostridium oryzae]|uniref:Fructose-specific phosphotransferase enzyme IIB component n=1 Tax=Clostridium oryzae TaxID=1450648 RepID=A0A1V4IKL1_9CLOT|nr:PTS sugar transporter subunit IIB [Clostridium oryzae]OPJ60399.1 fructose-specific phosphotransferase enzyme IIB component [Clostridium oryzae]